MNTDEFSTTVCEEMDPFKLRLLYTLDELTRQTGLTTTMQRVSRTSSVEEIQLEIWRLQRKRDEAKIVPMARVMGAMFGELLARNALSPAWLEDREKENEEEEEQRERTVLCPLCRKDNTIVPNQTPLFNANTQCVVCEEKPANVYMPQCGHVSLCGDCLGDLAT